MLQQSYFQVGTQISLPEISSQLAEDNDKFIVLNILQGGMGYCVHLRHIDSGSEFALKCIRSEFLDDKLFIDRFHDEIQVWLTASVCSHIAEAIAIVRINDTPAVLAHWMSGGDLARALPNLTPEHKFRVVVKVVRGLEWVWDNLKVIHRDLKPSNILLDSSNLAQVTDWGLSRPLTRQFENTAASLKTLTIQRPDRTQFGSFLGTILYAAPEQILDASSVDHKADIYSLGCILFEMETVATPFTGRTVVEVAQQHLTSSPPRLGGLFKKTKLGLEDVIKKCLEKNPAKRYDTYANLESELIAIAKKRGFNLAGCETATRYQRSVLGKGNEERNSNLKTVKKTIVGDFAYSIISADDHKKYWSEAANLIALNRFREAEALLQPYYTPEIFKPNDQWHKGHSMALNYAYALQRIDGRIAEALDVFTLLEQTVSKPAEFFANYSLALLQNGDANKAQSICNAGLISYPDDLDIIGNHTIALRQIGEFDAAYQSASRRLSLRRDVHSLEEAVSVLTVLRNAKRVTNLPEAITAAKEAGALIQEGLNLNPRFCSILLARIQLYRFAHHTVSASSQCMELMRFADCHRLYREMAFLQMLEILMEQGSFTVMFEKIEEFSESIKTEIVVEKYTSIKSQYALLTLYDW